MDEYAAELTTPEFGEEEPSLRALQRDLGLQRGITALPLAASIVNIVVGAAIFTLPAAVAQQAGAAAPAAYLVTAMVMAAITICFAEAGSRVPTSGGAYGTVEAAFGPATGFVVGMLFLVSDVLANGGIAVAIADIAGAHIPMLSPHAGRIAVIAALYLGLSGINVTSVSLTARLLTLCSALKLLPLLFFLMLGLISLAWPAPPGPLPPNVTLAGFGRALLLTLFAFQGMEIALGASGEVQNPSRTLPRALFLTMLFVLALYLGAQLGAQHMLGTALANSQAPLADAAGRFGPTAQIIVLAGAVISMIGYLAGDVLGTSRMIFAMARDGCLPRFLGRVRPTSRIPLNAVLSYIAGGCVVACTGGFLELVVLSALATCAIYILTCLAALALRRRRVALAGVPLDFAGLPAAAALGLIGMGGMLAAARWAELLGLAGVIGFSLCFYRLHKGFSRGARA